MKPRFGSPAGKAALLLLVLAPSAPVDVFARKQDDTHRFPKRIKSSRQRQRSRRQVDPMPWDQVRRAIEDGCPYAIDSEEEAISRMNDASLPGNVVKVEHLSFCRTGNHFSSFFRNLALGYCCKSKVVWLPPKDDVLAPGVFNEGTPGPRWFDFSSAPDVRGFDSSTCAADITWAGQRAFHMYQLETPGHEYHTPGLKECIKHVPRLLGCEAAYYFPKDVDVCNAAAAPSASAEQQQRQQRQQRMSEVIFGGKRDELERRNLAEETHPGNDKKSDVGQGEASHSGRGLRGRGGGGTLVLHVRSGDIFHENVLSYYGQPPLQFYMQVIQHAHWDRVDVVTNAPDKRSLNPVIPALQGKLSRGELPTHVHIHTNRTMEEDLRAMICADGLALAKSTLVSLTGFHSKAKKIYGPMECNSQLSHLALHRPEVQTYGLVWSGKYSVYKNWKNTPDQRREMLAYDRIRGFNQCTTKERG